MCLAVQKLGCRKQINAWKNTRMYEVLFIVRQGRESEATETAFCLYTWLSFSWQQSYPYLWEMSQSDSCGTYAWIWNMRLWICMRTHLNCLYIIRAKRVSNWYTPQKKSARLPACTCQIILVLVFTYVNTYNPSQTYVDENCRGLRQPNVTKIKLDNTQPCSLDMQ